MSKWLSCRVSTMHVGLLKQFLHSENINKLLDLLVSSQQYPLGSLQRNCFRSGHHELCDKDMFAELLGRKRWPAARPARRAVFLILAHSQAHTLPLHCLSFSLSLSLVLYLFLSFSLEGKSLSLESVLASDRKERALRTERLIWASVRQGDR